MRFGRCDADGGFGEDDRYFSTIRPLSHTMLMTMQASSCSLDVYFNNTKKSYYYSGDDHIVIDMAVIAFVLDRDERVYFYAHVRLIHY